MGAVSATPPSVCTGSNSVLATSATAVPASGYCSPSTTSGGTVGDEITAFTSGGLGYTYANAVQTPAPGYINRTTLTPAGNAVAGTTYTVSIAQQDAGDVESRTCHEDY